MDVKIRKTAGKKAAVKKSTRTMAKAAKTEAMPVPFERGIAAEMARLRHEIDQTFERVFHGWPDWPSLRTRLFEPSMFKDIWAPVTMPRAHPAPRVDVGETDKAYEITAELPGMEEKDVEVTLTDAGLTIKGEKKTEREEEEKEYHRIERSFGSFQRFFALPEGIDQANIDAMFKNGVLTVILPKTAAAKTRTRKIKVKAA